MAASVVFWQKYPLGVRQYKTIILGMPAAEKAETIWGGRLLIIEYLKNLSFCVFARR